MITGGTGSFGNAVLNRFLNTEVKEIRIFSRDEKKQDDMRHRLNNTNWLGKEKELTEQIEELIQKAERSDSEEDEEYNDKTGYEIPEELKFKENRLAKIKAAKAALEKREQELNSGKKIDDKKQISFADKNARIVGKNGNFQYAYNGQVSVDKDNQIIVGHYLPRMQK